MRGDYDELPGYTKQKLSLNHEAEIFNRKLESMIFYSVNFEQLSLDWRKRKS